MADDQPWQQDDDTDRDEVSFDTLVEADCPHCGEPVVLTLDAGGGSHQEYIEDCQVCCRPWRVHVFYDDGAASVRLDDAT